MKGRYGWEDSLGCPAMTSSCSGPWGCEDISCSGRLHLRPSCVFVQLPHLIGQHCSLTGCPLLPWCSNTYLKSPSKTGTSVPMTSVACVSINSQCLPPHLIARTSFRSLKLSQTCVNLTKLVKCMGFTQCNSDGSLFWLIPGRFFCFSAHWLQCRTLKFGAGQLRKHCSG